MANTVKVLVHQGMLFFKTERLTISGDSKFARSLKRINQTQAQQAPSTLGGDFPYEPGDLVNFLGPHGRIGQGYITGIFGKEYRVAHSGT